MSKIAVS